MNTKPILFQGAMVRALLDGSKTQTRRICKGPIWEVRDGQPKSAIAGCDPVCPYGQPGDQLWVREAWSTHASFDRYAPSELTHVRSFHYWADGDAVTGKKRPSIHMPRWASRITLEITGVRVERLQGISEVDAKAEGALQMAMVGSCDPIFSHPPFPQCHSRGTFQFGYQVLWEQINGPESWAANPWVWVVEFRVIKP